MSCVAFLVIAVVTGLSLPGNTKSGIHVIHWDAWALIQALIGTRILFGLLLAERSWKAWFYPCFSFVLFHSVSFLLRQVRLW